MQIGVEQQYYKAPLRRLFGFLMVLAVSGFVAYAYQAWLDLEQETTDRLSLISQLLSRTTNEVFEHHTSMLHVLGERLLELDAGSHPESGRELVDNLLVLNPTLAGLGLARPDGQLILVSGIPAGQPLPNLLQQPQSAESFRQVVESGDMVSGRTYYLPLLQRWVLPLRVPVRDEKGQTQLIMSLGIDVASEYTTWNLVDLPEATEVRILRDDGFWQFVNPVAEEQRSATYEQAIDAHWMDVIRSGSTRQGSAGSLFLYKGKLCLGSYLPGRGLYTLVSFPYDSVLALYRARMLLPTVLFCVVLLVGSGFFMIAYRQQHTYEARLIQQAHFDGLTGLPNRILVMDRMQQLLQQAARERHKLVLVFIDLDHFKRINDSFGHLVGDRFLAQCAERLQGLFRSVDTVARLGGDEFLILLPGIQDIDAVETVIHKLHASFRAPFKLEHRQIFSTCSVGLAVFPDDGGTPEALMKAADTALYKAKSAGRDTHRFYSVQMNQEAQRRMELESALQDALKHGEMSLVYQPQVDLASGRWTGCEALLRWNSKALGPISPMEFIPVAEESGLIRQLGDFVMENACRDLVRIKAATDKRFRMAVNLSAVQLHQHDLAEDVTAYLQDNNLQVTDLELEITESMMLENAEQLGHLHDLGVSIAVDDFGTGFCSLSYLHRFPVTTLKVDRSFVTDIENSPAEARLVTAIINLGNSLELEVIAEGIETQGQLDYLYKAGCRFGQGYHFCRPMVIEELLDGVDKKTSA